MGQGGHDSLMQGSNFLKACCGEVTYWRRTLVDAYPDEYLAQQGKDARDVI
jgi:hypothetical protein